MLHSFWIEDPRFLHTFPNVQREYLQETFGESSFSSSTEFMCAFSVTQGEHW